MCFYYCKALPSGEDDEEDSDSDSDDDDVKVTIGNIKTGAPSYMYVWSEVDLVNWLGLEVGIRVGLCSGDMGAMARKQEWNCLLKSIVKIGMMIHGICCWKINQIFIIPWLSKIEVGKLHLTHHLWKLQETRSVLLRIYKSCELTSFSCLVSYDSQTVRLICEPGSSIAELKQYLNWLNKNNKTVFFLLLTAFLLRKWLAHTL